MPVGKFDKKAPVKTKVKESRFGAFDPRERGPGMLDAAPEPYRMRVVDVEECRAQKPGGRDSIKAYVTTPNSSSEDDKRVVLFMRTPAGESDFKSFVVAAAGYAGKDEYDDFDPGGFFFEAALGDANEYSAADLTIVGRLIDIKVVAGKDDGQGSYYRNYRFTPVDDADQDQIGKLAAE